MNGRRGIPIGIFLKTKPTAKNHKFSFHEYTKSIHKLNLLTNREGSLKKTLLQLSKNESRPSKFMKYTSNAALKAANSHDSFTLPLYFTIAE